MLELRNITKRFGDVLANDRVNLVVRPGTIHAIVGENGAGKSTAMRIAYGFYTPDSGEIIIDGKPREIRTPHDAIALGVGMVHQHFMLVETMTVAENIVLGAEPGGAVSLDLNKAAAEISSLSQEFKLAVDPNATIEGLSVGQQQRVELLKALYRHARLLILDEPTAVLSPQEVEEFFTILKGMRDQGKTIVIITHKLSEVLAISDDVTVMRDGKVVGEVKTKETNAAELARLMVGREVLLRIEKAEAKVGSTELRVSDLSVTAADGQKRVDGISFEVRQGEIVGIAGVEGNGQSELIEALAGVQTPSGGEVALGAEPVVSWQYPTGKALRDLLFVIWGFLLLEGVFALFAAQADRGRLVLMTGVFVARVVFQFLVIWFLARALKKGAKGATIAVGILAVLSLSALARLLLLGQLEGVEIFGAMISAALLIYAIVLAVRTYWEFGRREKSEIVALNPRQIKELGVGHIPEDRHRRGLLLDFDLAENSILGVHYRPPAVHGVGDAFLNQQGIRQRASEIIRAFDVRPPNWALPARALSGGNQQKLIIGREFELNPKLLLVSQPTRGVDIGAIEFIHSKLVGLRDAGCAVLLVSAELEEVTALADRLLIIHEGSIAGEVDPRQTSVEEIGLLMTRGHL
ncbi:MAG: ABC transporter ATP-binding protein [Pyrinomonadaceae bacterium]